MDMDKAMDKVMSSFKAALLAQASGADVASLEELWAMDQRGEVWLRFRDAMDAVWAHMYEEHKRQCIEDMTTPELRRIAAGDAESREWLSQVAATELRYREAARDALMRLAEEGFDGPSAEQFRASLPGRTQQIVGRVVNCSLYGKPKLQVHSEPELRARLARLDMDVRTDDQVEEHSYLWRSLHAVVSAREEAVGRIAVHAVRNVLARYMPARYNRLAEAEWRMAVTASQPDESLEHTARVFSDHLREYPQLRHTSAMDAIRPDMCPQLVSVYLMCWDYCPVGVSVRAFKTVLDLFVGDQAGCGRAHFEELPEAGPPLTYFRPGLYDDY